MSKAVIIFLSLKPAFINSTLIKVGHPSNIIHDINTKIYTHTNNLLNVVNA